AKLQDVEVGDFVRFCEYAYRGDYTVPAWSVDQNLANEHHRARGSTATPSRGSSPKPNIFGNIPTSGSSAAFMNPTDPAQDLRTKFRERKYLRSGNPKALEISNQCAPRPNSSVSKFYASLPRSRSSIYLRTHATH
ncbi:hypothetical protein K491DRAFT_734881, partial [Lophiostoma macrostomum CBS 122681]